MREEARQRDKLIGIFVLGVVLFNPPLLSLVSGAMLFGWPLLYIYLFVVWAGLIAAIAFVVERRSRRRGGALPED